MITEKSEASSLFETLTINSIQDIEIKTRHEIEKRKEDLRQLVGERYRDLIEAADTIRDMKSSVDSFSDHVKRIHDFSFNDVVNEDTSSNLQYSSRCSAISNLSLYVVAGQLHLLFDIPEKICNFLDNGDMLSASLYYGLAQEIQANLKLFHNGDSIKSLFPVIERHRASFDQFHDVIYHQSCNALGCRTNSKLDKAQSLCAILLLTKKPPRELCKIYLQSQSNILKEFFKADQSSNAKDLTMEVATIILDALQTYQALFYNADTLTGKHSILMSILDELNDANKMREKIRFVIPREFQWVKYLPDHVHNFMPEFAYSGSDFSNDFLKEFCENWMETVQQEISSQLGKILSYVTTVKMISVIRDAVASLIFETDEWPAILSDCKTNLWAKLFGPLFFKQMQHIVGSSFASIEVAVKSQVKHLASFVENTSEKEINFDTNISDFVWSEEPIDTAVEMSSEQRLSPLTLKAKGFSPNVEKICSEFDNRLRALLEDLAFISTLDVKLHDGIIPNDITGLESLQLFISQACVSTLNNLLDFIEIPTDLCNPVGNHDVSIYLWYSGLCRAIPELCPHLQKAIVSPFPKPLVMYLDSNVMKLDLKTTALKTSNDIHWIEIVNKLQGKSMQCLSVWRAILCNDMHKCLDVVAFDPSTILKSAPQWDHIEIHEESEEGVNIKSTISVPLQPSFYLQETLHWLCSTLNKAGGHTLPTKLLQDIRNDFLDAILTMYESHAQKQNITSQRCALQLLFDLRFAAGFMMNSNNEEYVNRIQRLTMEYEDCVDPFDLDVFSPYIAESLKRCIHRFAIIFGPLAAASDRPTMGSTTSPAVISHQEQYNVVALSSGGKTRFTLLPLGSSASNKPLASTENVLNIKRKDEGESLSAKLYSGSSVEKAEIPKSASTSFFGAMSSSWFGN